MAGIAVPHAPSVEPYVQLPPPPEAPPTDKDVILAHEYVQQVERARCEYLVFSSQSRLNHKFSDKDDDVQEADYAGATRYKATVLASTGGASSLQPIRQRFSPCFLHYLPLLTYRWPTSVVSCGVGAFTRTNKHHSGSVNSNGK